MPVVNVEIDQPARVAYLDLYKAEAQEAINQRVRDIWSNFSQGTPWMEMVLQHRAIQGFAYLNDPDGETNIVRYNLIPLGIPSYGATHAEVAGNYVSNLAYFSQIIHNLYEDRRHAVNEYIPVQVDKPQVDTVRDTFLNTWTVTDPFA